MLNNYFHSQADHTIKTRERLKKLNDKHNSNIKHHDNFKTNYEFKNRFYQNLGNLKEKSKEDDTIISINSSIKFIHQVYQSSFANIKKTTGFGDFVRGCLYVLEICEKYNIRCDFHIKNHNIQKYLKYFVNKPEITDYISTIINKYLDLNAEFTCKDNKIDYHINFHNDAQFISYLNSCPIYDGNIFINTTNFPLHRVSNNNLGIIKHLLEPTDELNKEIEHHMNQLKLTKKNFITYHIRLGDYFLENPDHTIINGEIIQYILDKMIINPEHNYLLITDSLILKKIIVTYYQNLKCIFFDISHTCENDASSIKNTLIEFYMMSYSKAIISMSVYPHGSGFSKWCSVVYGIPYVCYLLPKVS